MSIVKFNFDDIENWLFGTVFLLGSIAIVFFVFRNY